MKRSADIGPRLSPPPAKRRVNSSTTNEAIASFFTPASTKPPGKLNWRIVNGTLLVGKYGNTDRDSESAAKRRKIAAFDFDSTLIQTSSGNVFGRNPTDWRWWHPTVPGRLRELYADGYRVVIISNQAGLNLKTEPKTMAKEKRLSDFKTKVSYVFAQLDLPISIYAATAKDQYRKPRMGTWKEFLTDYALDVHSGPFCGESVFVGDAAGRMTRKDRKADHSTCDRDFAANAGIEFKTPEEFFLSEESQPFQRGFDPLAYLNSATSTDTTTAIESPKTFQYEKRNQIEIVLCCGSPGAGKSTFYWNSLQPLGYERVNQDTLKTRDKCLRLTADYLAGGKSVVVDNTNADIDTRRIWVDLAKTKNVPIRALNEALFNPEKRTMLPAMAFRGYHSRFSEPKLGEGFQDIIRVPFQFQGTDEQRSIWTKYWM